MTVYSHLAYSPLRGFSFLFAAWLTAFALITFSTPAYAQTNWIGATSDWFAASNWSTGILPGAGDDVFINTGSFAPSVMNGAGATVAGLNIGGQFDGNAGVIVTGSGSLSILNGAQLTNNPSNFFGTSVGVGTGSAGSVTISGVGSNWTSSSGAVLVGAAGANGSLALNNQGTAAFGALIVGASLNDILGTGVTNSSGFSTGTLTVTGGSQLTAGNFADIGAGTGTSGKVTVSGAGSTFSSDGGVFVGVLGGAGTFDVLNGGTLTTGTNAPYGVSVIGGGPSNMGAGPVINGGVGAMTISGAGSTWTNTGGIYVGGFVDLNAGIPYSGIGTLTVADGAKMTSSSGFNGGLPDAIGIGPGSIGAAVVTGAGSQWTAGQHLIVGYAAGKGTLTIENGGTVDVAGITGAGIGIDPAFSQSAGTINVLSGGTLISNSLGLGAQLGPPVNFGAVIGASDSTGAALVSGVGSSWIITGGLFVGGATALGVGPGTGTVTIANGGTIRASEGVALAQDAGSFGTLNLGAASGSPAVAPGTLDTPTVTFGDGTGVVNFNHTAADYVFAAAISGPGAVNQIAGTTILTGNSTYTNATTISGGVLRVNGSLGNTAVTVDNGGKLGGSGSIAGPVTVAAGGIIAPGNSIGTLTLGGNFTQAAGAIYQVELNTAGQSDLLVVGGTATIQNGAVLQVIRSDAATSPFVIGTRYTILAAAGGSNGTWTTLTGDAATAFIDLGFGQNANSIYLDALRNNVRFADVGFSTNQRVTGAAVENLGTANPLYTAVVQSITPQAARTAFDLTSGEIHAGMASAAYDDSRAPRTAILDRLRNPSVNSPSNLSANFSDSASQSAPDAHAAWGQVFGDYGRIGGNDNAATINRSLGGFIIGTDASLADHYRVGIAGGYTKSTLDVDARASSGSIESKFGGVYGSADFGPLQLRTGALYADNRYETDRSIVFPGFQDAAHGSYSGSTSQVFSEAGWWLSAPDMTIEPFAGLSLIRIRMNAFSETGGAAALQGQPRSYNYRTTTMGVRVASTPLTGPILRGALGWQHVFGDVTPASVLAFNGASGASTPFSITGAPVARDSLLAEAGIEWRFARRASAGIFYSGVIGRNAYMNAIQGRLMMAF